MSLLYRNNTFYNETHDGEKHFEKVRNSFGIRYAYHNSVSVNIYIQREIGKVNIEVAQPSPSVSMVRINTNLALGEPSLRKPYALCCHTYC